MRYGVIYELGAISKMLNLLFSRNQSTKLPAIILKVLTIHIAPPVDETYENTSEIG